MRNRILSVFLFYRSPCYSPLSKFLLKSNIADKNLRVRVAVGRHPVLRGSMMALEGGGKGANCEDIPANGTRLHEYINTIRHPHHLFLSRRPNVAR